MFAVCIYKRNILFWKKENQKIVGAMKVERKHIKEKVPENLIQIKLEKKSFFTSPLNLSLCLFP